MVPTNLNKWINWAPNAGIGGNLTAQDIYEEMFVEFAQEHNFTMVCNLMGFV